MSRNGRAVGRRESLACAELGRCRKCVTRVHGKAEAGNGCCGDGRDGDVSGNDRIWHGGYARLCEDRIVSGTQEIDRGFFRGSTPNSPSGGHGAEGGGEDEDEAGGVGREEHGMKLCEKMKLIGIEIMSEQVDLNRDYEM